MTHRASYHSHELLLWTQPQRWLKTMTDETEEGKFLRSFFLAVGKWMDMSVHVGVEAVEWMANFIKYLSPTSELALIRLRCLYPSTHRIKCAEKVWEKCFDARGWLRSCDGEEKSSCGKSRNFIKFHPPSFCIILGARPSKTTVKCRWGSFSTLICNFQRHPPHRRREKCLRNFYGFYSFIKIIFTHQYNESFMLLWMVSLDGDGCSFAS